MKKSDIPRYIVDRVIDRRGTEHIHADLNPATTALLVVDLQNAFMVEEHASAYVEEAVGIVPDVNRLAQAVRETGGKVFWIRNTITDESRRSWSHWFDMASCNPELAALRQSRMETGSIGHELYAGLKVEPQDETVYKHRFSALIQGSSDLDQRLRAQGFDTVLVTGTVTNVCCESTARDAMMLNYKTIMVSDCNAAMTEREHNASLSAFYASFGDVMDSDMVISHLTANAERKAAE